MAMHKKTPILLITPGTRASLIGASLKRIHRKSPASYNPFRLVAIDTAFDAVELDELEESEKMMLADLPIKQMKEHPEAYPAFGEVPFEHLEDVVALKAGALVVPTTHAAFIAKYPHVESRIMGALQELGSACASEAASVWVVGSVSSTTARGIMLETLFLVNRIVQKQGVFYSVNCVILDSEGLAPTQREMRQRIEGGFYRELERAVLSSPSRPIPRPHDVAWTAGSPAGMVFRFTGANSAQGNLRSVDELASAVTDWMAASVLDPVTFNLVSGPAGDRGRLLPSVQPPTDGHLVDPRLRYINCSGISSVSLNTPAVALYAEAERAQRSLARIEGAKRPTVENLIRELRLDYAVLANAAGEAGLLTSINRQLSGLQVELTKIKASDWGGQVHTTLHNLGRQMEQAQALVGRKVDETLAGLCASVQARSASFVLHPAGSAIEASMTALGLNGVIAYLSDVLKQNDEVKTKATAKLGSPLSLGDLHRKVDEILEKLSSFSLLNRTPRETLMSLIRQGYGHAMELVVAGAILALAQAFQAWCEQRLQEARAALATIQRAQEVLLGRKRQALATHKPARVHFLANDENEVLNLISNAGLIQPDLVEAATSKMLEKMCAKSELLVGLGTALPEALAESAVQENAALSPVGSSLKTQFGAQFNAKFPSAADAKNIFRWLVENSRPLSGVIDSTLEHRLMVSKIEYLTVLIPAGMAELSKRHLLPLGIAPSQIREVDGLDSIVCVNERLGLPAHAFQYIKTVGKMLPNRAEDRGPLTVARWASKWLPTIENYEPFQGWSNPDLIHAGIMTGALCTSVNEITLVCNTLFLGADLAEATGNLTLNGHTTDLKKGIRSALDAMPPEGLATARKAVVESGKMSTAEANSLYLKLQPFHTWLQS